MINNIKHLKLKNEMNLYLYPISDIEIVTVEVWVNTGSKNETATNSGISHFLEHMVFKKTENFTALEKTIAIDSSGGYINAATSKEYTKFYISIPRDEAEEAFKVLSDIVFKATFTESEIESEKSVVVQEINRKYNQPDYKMWEKLSKILYENTNYSREIIGTIDNVNAFTASQLKDYYETYYQPENMWLVVVGDIKDYNLIALAEKYFSHEKNTPKAIIQENIETEKIKERYVENFYTDISSSYGLIVYKIDEKYHWETSILLDITTELFAGGALSLLNKRFRDEMKKVNFFTAGSIEYHIGSSLIFYFMSTEKNHTDVIEAFEDIVLNEKKHLSNASIEKAKNRCKANFLFDLETINDIAGLIGHVKLFDSIEMLKYDKMIDLISRQDIIGFIQNTFKIKPVILSTLPEKKETDT